MDIESVWVIDEVELEEIETQGVSEDMKNLGSVMCYQLGYSR